MLIAFVLREVYIIFVVQCILSRFVEVQNYTLLGLNMVEPPSGSEVDAWVAFM